MANVYTLKDYLGDQNVENSDLWLVSTEYLTNKTINGHFPNLINEMLKKWAMNKLLDPIKGSKRVNRAD